MMNREIEAHYAQYLFLRRSVEWTDKKQDKYAKSQRLRATTSLTKYVNQQGHVTTSFLDIFETYISNNVVNAFRQEDTTIIHLKSIRISPIFFPT